MLRVLFDRHVIAELAPAAIFFATHLAVGINYATAAAMLATALAVAVQLLTGRRVPWIAIATLAIVLVLGSMTLILDDVRFVKMKPTVGKILFATALLVGLKFHPTFLERALGGLLHLTDAGWRVLTHRWTMFASAQAFANEVVWRSVSTDSWVLFKTLLVPISVLGYILITRRTAPHWWDVEAERSSVAKKAHIV